MQKKAEAMTTNYNTFYQGFVNYEKSRGIMQDVSII